MTCSEVEWMVARNARETAKSWVDRSLPEMDLRWAVSMGLDLGQGSRRVREAD